MDGAALFSRSAPNANAFDGFNFADLRSSTAPTLSARSTARSTRTTFPTCSVPTAPTLPTCPDTGALPPAAVHAEPRAPHARCRCRMPSAARLTRTSSGPSRTHGRPQKPNLLEPLSSGRRVWTWPRSALPTASAPPFRRSTASRHWRLCQHCRQPAPGVRLLAPLSAKDEFRPQGAREEHVARSSQGSARRRGCQQPQEAVPRRSFPGTPAHADPHHHRSTYCGGSVSKHRLAGLARCADLVAVAIERAFR